MAFCGLTEKEVLAIAEHEHMPEIAASSGRLCGAKMVDSLPWNLSLDGLLRELGAAPAGLSNKEAQRRLAEYGPNDALICRRRPLWRQTLDRLANPLILILLFASGLSAWTGEVTSFVIIVVIILLSVPRSRRRA